MELIMPHKRPLIVALCLTASMMTPYASESSKPRQADYYGQTFILSDRSSLPYGSAFWSLGIGTHMGYGQHGTSNQQSLHQGLFGPALLAGLGYEKNLLKYYFIAAEAQGLYAYQIHKERHYTNSANWDIQIKAPVQFSFALMPGAQLHNQDVFYLISKFNLLSLKKDTSLASESRLGKGKKFSMNALSYGLGYKLKIDESTSARFDFSQMHASKTKLDSLHYERNINQMHLLINHYITPINQIIPSDELRDGFYVSLGGGLSSLVANQVRIDASSGSKNHNLEMGDTGITGHTSIGYEFLLDQNTLLGLEAGYAYHHSAIDSHKKENNVALLRQGNAYELNLIAGRPFKNGSLLSGLIGFNASQFDKEQSPNSQSQPRDNLGPRFSEYLFGLNLGLGYTSFILDHWALRGEFQHQVFLPYRKTSKNTDGTNSQHYDWTLQSSQMTLSIRYYL